MYTLLIYLARVVVFLASPFSGKLRLFVRGRRNAVGEIAEAFRPEDNVIWFHSASYGEFEEIRPIISATRSAFPDAKILLTFFSPSGYEHLKDCPLADKVSYLPWDTPSAARTLVSKVHPSKVVFSKGEYWFNLLNELHGRGVGTYLVSLNVKADSPYLKWYGFMYRYAWKRLYNSILAQNEATVYTLASVGVASILAGDPRMDRVLESSRCPWSDSAIETWLGGEKAFVFGSLCPGEDEDMAAAVAEKGRGIVMIIPHDPHPEAVSALKGRIGEDCALYSDMAPKTAKVLIIDKVGLLSKLYRYAYGAYVGAGFTTDTPHSVIEAAAYGVPVSFGPRYNGNPHCIGLRDCGAGFPVRSAEELLQWQERLLSDNEWAGNVSSKALDYCIARKGATERIMDVLFRNPVSFE